MGVRRWIAVALALLVAVALGGCAARVGTTATESQWRDGADQVLGSAIGSLGTARTVLEARASGDLPQAYAVVAVQDATDVLEKDLGAFVESRAPRSMAAADQEVVDQVQDAVRVLHTAGTALNADAGTRRSAADQLSRAYDDCVAAREAVGAAP